MQAFQPFACINLFFVLFDILNVKRLLFEFEVSREHFSAGVIHFTSPIVCKVVHAEAFCVKLTTLGAFSKTSVLQTLRHVTFEHSVFYWLDDATQINVVKEKQDEKAEEQGHLLKAKWVS